MAIYLKYIKKIIFYAFIFYLLTLPFTESLNYKIYGKVGLDNLFLSFIFLINLSLITYKIITQERIRVSLRDNIINNFLVLFFLSFFIPLAVNIQMFEFSDESKITKNLSFLIVFPLVIILWFLIENFKDYKIILLVFIISGLLAALIGILQILDIDLFWEISEKYYIQDSKNLYNSFINHTKAPAFFGQSGNTLGAFMFSCSVVILVLRRLLIRGKKIRILIFIILFGGLISSFSVTSIFTFIFITLVYILLVLSFNKFKIKINKKLVSEYFFTAITILFMILVSIRAWSNRLSRKFFNLSIGKDRFGIWQNFFQEDFKNRNLSEMFFGKGYIGTNTLDNFYVQQLSAGGILLLCLYIFLIIKLLLKSYYGAKIYYFNKNYLSKIYTIVFLLLLGMNTMNITANYINYQQVLLPIIFSMIALTKLEFIGNDSL